MGYTLQIQTVLYNNSKEALEKSFMSFDRAVEINQLSCKDIESAVLVYGDASEQPLYSKTEIDEINIQLRNIRIEYMFFDENTGTSRGHNKMLQKCKSDFIFIINPDIIVIPRIFERLFMPFKDSEKNAGIAEARQTPVEHPKLYDKVSQETSWASGACSLIPTSVFREIGGYDESTFYMYCDDVDCSWRVRLTGRKVYYCPDAVVFHAKRLLGAGNLQPSSFEKTCSAEANILMAYKWSNEKRADKLVDIYSKSGDRDYLLAVENYMKRKEKGELPKQVDREHRVAKFIDGNYSKHRFLL
ncbi:GT2 family glycosyltransferase [Ohessyouella blattaphilus]|uniref:glycosyltransferase n=1 Tax=Ohessyouella blattaphilus TaxID=2949333 RepID=UPI003EB71D4F